MSHHRLVMVAATLLAVYSLSPAASSRPVPGDVTGLLSAGNSTGDAESVLNQARASLGGSKALESVTTLEIQAVEERQADGPVPAGATVYEVRPEPFRFRMRWPGRFQFTRPSFTHTLNGPAFWLEQTGGTPVPVSPDIETTARRSTELNAAYLTLAFLLRTPPWLRWQPRYLGVTKTDGIEGPTVEFIGPTGHGPKVVFDSARHMPVAVVTTARRMDGSGERVVQVVRRLEDYRNVGELRFPFRLDERAPGYHIIRRISIIRVNPPLGLRDFAKPSR